MTQPEERDIQAFVAAVGDGDVARTRTLLSLRHVQERVNDPLFAFGQRATHIAAKNPALLTVLLEHGADLQLKSDWANGPYTVLDVADEDSARFLLDRGAVLTANVCARLGWLDELRALIAADPSLVHARGGDGQQPLHEARSVAIADVLLDHGADPNVRCLDHASTPAQYALVDRPDVCRRLLARGAEPDIFMPARLGEPDLAERIIDADPACLDARIGTGGYAPVPPLGIYRWSLGFGSSPHDVALRFGHHRVHGLMVERSSPRVRLVHALLRGDAAAAEAVVASHPSALPAIQREPHGHLAQAIFHEQFAAAELMLRLGFDPRAPGEDGGTALHAACWVGSAHMVRLLLARGGVPLDAPDPTHRSPPLGWAAFGSVQRRARGGDYVAVIDLLAEAGADVGAAGNLHGRTLVQMANGNPQVQEALRRHGAR